METDIRVRAVEPGIALFPALWILHFKSERFPVSRRDSESTLTCEPLEFHRTDNRIIVITIFAEINIVLYDVTTASQWSLAESHV